MARRLKLPKLRSRGLVPITDARLIVGLGNPGAEYAQHRHNAGLRAAEHARRLLALPQPQRERLFRLAQGETEYGPVAVALPRAWMNESGRAVQALLTLYRAKPERLILLVDELDLAPGRIRVRADGSDAGQRGMRSIRQTIGALDFPRVRIGVGRPIIDERPSHDPEAVAAHLLADPTRAERELLHPAEQRAAEAAIHLLSHEPEETMNLFN